MVMGYILGPSTVSHSTNLPLRIASAPCVPRGYNCRLDTRSAVPQIVEGHTSPLPASPVAGRRGGAPRAARAGRIFGFTPPGQHPSHCTHALASYKA